MFLLRETERYFSMRLAQQRFCAWLDSIGGPDCNGGAGQTRASAHVRVS
jgi:hypothetical protein